MRREEDNCLRAWIREHSNSSKKIVSVQAAGPLHSGEIGTGLLKGPGTKLRGQAGRQFFSRESDSVTGQLHSLKLFSDFKGLQLPEGFAILCVDDDRGRECSRSKRTQVGQRDRERLQGSSFSETSRPCARSLLLSWVPYFPLTGNIALSGILPLASPDRAGSTIRPKQASSDCSLTAALQVN